MQTHHFYSKTWQYLTLEEIEFLERGNKLIVELLNRGIV